MDDLEKEFYMARALVARERKEQFDAIAEKTREVRDKIWDLEHSFGFCVEKGSILGLLCPWITVINYVRKKKISKLKADNAEALKEYEEAERNLLISNLVM